MKINQKLLIFVDSQDEIVISGVSGTFPSSENMAEYAHNLLNKVDMISSERVRYKTDHPDVPKRCGNIGRIDRFDNTYFNVTPHEANCMEPMVRILLEKTFEAVVDSGEHPDKLRGSNCGVFIGGFFMENRHKELPKGREVRIVEAPQPTLANQISYYFGCTGPTLTVDVACSSSLFALEAAYLAFRDGLIDSAIVGGANLCSTSHATLQFSRLGVLSMDGKCKVFDEAANGYVRSEAISVIYLQKMKNAKRNYGTIVYSKTNCDGYKPEGITFPSGKMQEKLFRTFYNECGICPTSLAYMEAHGTGTRVGDPEEANSIDRYFTPGRTTPLKIGSVKSNIGHTEPASGICSIAKVIIAFETGIIPPNLYYHNPRKDIPALTEGRFQVISEKTPLEGDLVGVNSFGFGGGNAHVLLRRNNKKKIHEGLPQDNIPRLVLVSGRTAEAVTCILDDLEKRSIDVEYVALLQNIFSKPLNAHRHKGYAILQKGDKPLLLREVAQVPLGKKPIVLMFGGLNSQSSKLDSSLLIIPAFAAAINKCDSALKPHSVDIYKILSTKPTDMLSALLRNTAIQIGLADILKTLQMVPDFIIGYSIGELGCAYADGCLTAEETILVAYAIGTAISQTELPKVIMMEVGVGSTQMNCPKDVDVACHNSSSSCTISGPAETIRKFTADLKKNGIVITEVNNLPFHSRCMTNSTSRLLQELMKVIQKPKPRSSKWISTSIPKNQNESHLGKHCSAEYFISNLNNPVLFSEVFQNISPQAIAINIGSLGKYIPATIKNYALTRVDTDPTKFLLEAIGKLYFQGLQPQLAALYPAVQFPVSLGTPMISSLIKWRHTDKWATPYCEEKQSKNNMLEGERLVTINIKETSEFKYIRGHMIDGRVLYPATGYLFLLWETFSIMQNINFEETVVVFEYVKFIRSTNIPKEADVELHIMIQKGTGQFEVIESGATVVTGRIRFVEDSSEEFLPLDPLESPIRDQIQLQRRDIYKELRLRGYNYGDEFRGILECDLDATSAKIEWRENWTAFMDTLLQLQILHEHTRSLFVPTIIQKLTIDPKVHPQHFINSTNMYSDLDTRKKEGLVQEKYHLNAYLYKHLGVLKSGGVEIRGLDASSIARRRPLGEPVLERQVFIPYKCEEKLSVSNALRVCIQLALDNTPTIKVKVMEIDNVHNEPLAETFLNVLEDLPLISSDYTIISNRELEVPEKVVVEKVIPSELDAMFVIASNLSSSPEVLAEIKQVLKENGYLISRENLDTDFPTSEGYTILAGVCMENQKILVLRPNQKTLKNVAYKNVAYIKIDSDSKFSWLEQVKNTVAAQPTVLYAEDEPLSGLIGFVNCIRKEVGGDKTRAVFIIDRKAPRFDSELPFYKTQLDKGLAINILQDGKWGHYRHLQLNANLKKDTSQVYADILTRGDLSTMSWLEAPDLSECMYADIYYSSLNFRDIMLATGKLTPDVIKVEPYSLDCIQGFEFSGRDPKGKRVMGLVVSGALATRVQLPEDYGLIWEVPEHWSLEDAATVPTVYGTVYYALIIRGNLQPGQSILIHAGSGGVGQAAINLALFYKCKIFTTVGTQTKRNFIRETFPEIPESHIGNSRDTSFEQMVMLETNGKGVDLVLNSLSEEKLQASVRCLGEGGKFLEIGKFDMTKDMQLGLKQFMRGLSFYGILLDNLLHPDATLELKQMIYDLLCEGIANGAVKPLVRTIFNSDEVEKAYRYMGAGSHIGKVLIKIRPEEHQKQCVAKPFTTPAIPRVYFNPECSYIIVGGLGGFGLELTNWLLQRGARKVVLSSRNGVVKGYQALQIKRWRDYGIQVIISTADVTTVDGCTALLHNAKIMGPVAGIFNLSAVLRDALLENQTVENFEISFGGKVYGTRNLDLVSRKVCPNLKYFVVFSSVSCGRGNAGQTNYGMANSVMERICEKRVCDGLPGLAIQWGAIGEVGLVADMSESSILLEIGGTLQQSLRSCLQVMDTFLKQDAPVVASMVVAEKKAGSGSSDNVVDCVGNILGIRDLSTVSIHSTLAELGMDSMMAVEIKQSLEREYDVILSADDIRKLTLHKLQEIQKSLENNKIVVGNFEAGIGMLFRTLGDESLSEQILVKMPSLGKIKTPLFLIPGIEGNCTVFHTLSTKLEQEVYVLQTGTQSGCESIVSMAFQLFKVISSKLNSEQEFNIAAYSFGTLVAVELVLQLEAAGYKGKLLFIDGAPSVLRALGEILHGGSEHDVQVSVLITILKNIIPNNLGSIKLELEAKIEWDEKVKLFLSKVPDGIQWYSPKYQKALCDVSFSRVKSLNTYTEDSSRKFEASLMLVRPKVPLITNAADDYDLSHYTEKPIPVTTLDADHFTIIDHPQLVEIINNYFK